MERFFYNVDQVFFCRVGRSPCLPFWRTTTTTTTTIITTTTTRRTTTVIKKRVDHLPSHPRIQAPSKVSAHRSRGSVNKYCCRQQRSPLRVKLAWHKDCQQVKLPRLFLFLPTYDGKHDDKQDDNSQLCSGPNQRREKHWTGSSPENVPVHLIVSNVELRAAITILLFGKRIQK